MVDFRKMPSESDYKPLIWFQFVFFNEGQPLDLFFFICSGPKAAEMYCTLMDLFRCVGMSFYGEAGNRCPSSSFDVVK